MIASDWGDWLVREIEDADPDGVAVWYLGCNGFVVKGAATGRRSTSIRTSGWAVRRGRSA